MSHAVIIGATGGISSTLAKQLKDTYHLTLVGGNGAKLHELRNLTNGTIVPTDVSSELEVQALFENLSGVDLLVYSTGAYSA